MNRIGEVFKNEFRRIFRLRPAFAVLVGATVLYAMFYPQPYINEALRDVPIAIVDRDGTASSRELARRIDASPDIAVAKVLADLPSAEYEVYARNVFGILYIPKDFERDLLHGRSSPVALYADASYFLMYSRISGGVIAVTRTFGTEIEVSRLVAMGVDPAVAAAAADPMPLTVVSLFNPQAGYASYLLPAAFVLIVQQILLIGTGLLGTLGNEPGRKEPDLDSYSPVEIVAGKLLAYLALEAVIVPFYLYVLPMVYGLPHLGGLGSILIVGIPFVLAVSGLGMIMAAIFRKPLAVQLASAAIGLPFFFLAGFAWPPEAMPKLLTLVSHLIPSTPAIEAFVQISQLGASLHEARNNFFTLVALAILYCSIALMIETGRKRSLRAAPARG